MQYKQKNVSVLTYVGLCIGILGVGFVFYHNMFATIDGNLILGLFLSILAMLAWSLGTVFLARHAIGINSYYAMGWQMMLGAFMLFFLAPLLQKTIPFTEITEKSWMAILYLVGIGSIISFIAFIYSLKKLPPAISSLYAYINPIVAMLVAAFLLKEKLNTSIAIGTIVTLIGVYIVNHSIKRDREKIITEAEI